VETPLRWPDYPRRATSGRLARVYSFLLFLHFLGLALGVGTSFANLTLGLSMSAIPPAERVPFFLRISVLGKNGSIGLALLILTGAGMTLLRGVHETFEWGGPAFHAKLTLVAILSGLLGYLQVLVKRAKAEGGGPVMAKIPMVGRVMLVVGLCTVGAAVAAFH
jgi:hypothetical protein